MLYGSVSDGFKSGGVTTRLLADGRFDVFGPETLLAYEAGVKSRIADGRATLNAAAFYYDFKDLQVLSALFTGTTIESQVDNAASARIYGLDVNTAFRPTDRLSATLGFVYLPEAEFTSFETARGANLTGNRISRSPEWTGTAGLEYRVPIGSIGTLSSRLEYNYRSFFYFIKENDPLQAQDDFSLVNLSLRYTPASDKWYAFAIGRNLADEDYFTQVGFQSNPGLPATYEVGFGFRF
jgi:iron complex outermembrane receptor protein